MRADGTVKVLDFGLAKAMEPAAAGVGTSASMSPTISSPAMTQAGVILGTAAYMSPEQAKERPADKRSDVWAFGCVLYEMLAGKRAFEGEDVSAAVCEDLDQALPGEGSDGARRRHGCSAVRVRAPERFRRHGVPRHDTGARSLRQRMRWGAASLAVLLVVVAYGWIARTRGVAVAGSEYNRVIALRAITGIGLPPFLRCSV